MLFFVFFKTQITTCITNKTIYKTTAFMSDTRPGIARAFFCLILR
jgi:hypothetical protein